MTVKAKTWLIFDLLKTAGKQPEPPQFRNGRGYVDHPSLDYPRQLYRTTVHRDLHCSLRLVP